MYSNTDKLTAVLTHWLRPMGDAAFQQILGAKLQGINNWAKSVFPLSPDYTITNDIGFLIKPSVDMMVSPFVRKALDMSGVDDEHIPEYAHKLCDIMRDECAEKGAISVFDKFVINNNDVIMLKHLLEKNLPNSHLEEFEVMV